VPPFFIDYSYMTGHYAVLSLPVLAGLTILAALIGLTIWSWKRQDCRLLSFGFLWVGLFLLPVSNLLPMMQYMAERFLYLPLIGWLIALGAVLMKWPRRFLAAGASAALSPPEENDPKVRTPIETWRLSLIAAIVVVVVWASLAWQRSFIWQDELTLFVQSSQQGPKTLRVEQNAVAGIFHLPQVRELFVLDKSAHKLRTVGAISPKKAEQALHTLLEGRRLFPEDENIAGAMGISYSVLGQTNQAVECFEVAVRRRSEDPGFWSNLAIACLDAGRTSRAGEALDKALALDPQNIDALRSASRLYWQTEDFPAALAALRKLQEREPKNQDHAFWIRTIEQKLAGSPPPK